MSVPPTQASVENGTWVEYHPLTIVGDGSPIEFDISGTGEDYIDLANTMLYVQAKITKHDGTNLDANDPVGPVNLLLHSLFSQVDISLNGTQDTTSTNTYSYRAMLETLLSYGGDAKKSQLTSALYYHDQADRIIVWTLDSVAFDANGNSRLKTRKTFTTTSNPVDMICRIHADLFFQSRYLLNEVNVKIKLTRCTDTFCTMSPAANASKVRILSAIMYVRSQAVTIRVLGTFQGAGEFHGKVSDKSRGVQDLDDSECGDGCESKETVLWTDSHAHRYRPGA